MKGDNQLRMRQTLNVTMIALFVWSFMISTINFHQHSLDEMTECSTCHATKNFDLQHHNNTTVTAQENVAIQNSKRVEHVVIGTAFDYTTVNQPEEILHVGEQTPRETFSSLGFYATAPPYLIS